MSCLSASISLLHLLRDILVFGDIEMKKIEHIGIAVKDIHKSNIVFEKIFGKKNYKQEVVESEGVVTSFFQIGESKIELVASSKKDSPIDRFLNKNRQGVHHIAFSVKDISKEMKRLQAIGFSLLNETPKKGADNKLICFLDPRETEGVLIELCQEIQ